MADAPTIPDVPFLTSGSSLAAYGLTRAQVRTAKAAGTIRQLLTGVAVAAHVPDTVELRCRAVRLVVNPDHVLCDRTAAWVHGVDVMLIEEHELLPPVEVCALRGRQPSERDGVDGCVRDLRAKDIVSLDGLRVTSPLRTALDLGCHLRRREAFGALVDFARQHQITGERLTAELPRFRGRRGVVQLRGLTPLLDVRIESHREAWTYLAIRDAGLPAPQPQFWVEVDGGHIFRLDFAYPLSRIAIEYDGAEWHDLTADQRRHDEERRQWLRDHGWTVIVVRRGDFTGARLDRWLGQLERALRSTYTNRRF